MKRKELEVILDRQARRLEEADAYAESLGLRLKGVEAMTRNQDKLVRKLACLIEQVRGRIRRIFFVRLILLRRFAIASICVGKGMWKALLSFLMRTLLILWRLVLPVVAATIGAYPKEKGYRGVLLHLFLSRVLVVCFLFLLLMYVQVFRTALPVRLAMTLRFRRRSGFISKERSSSRMWRRW